MSDVKKNTEMKIAFIADGVMNFSKKDIFHDSSFDLMVAAQSLNVRVLLTESNNLKIINNKVFAKFDEVIVRKEEGNHIKVKNSCDFFLNDLDIIFARKDPPVNKNFFSYMLLLSSVPHYGDNRDAALKKSLIINSPTGMLKANEKLYTLNFPALTPPTMVTSRKEDILRFLKEFSEAVIKPLYDKGGSGIFYLNKNLENAQAIIEISTKNETSVVLVQKYLPEVAGGDKRIVLLNGEPLGAVLRVPKPGEFRANMSRGAVVKAYKLTKRDLEICEVLKPHLQKDGLYFTGIDVIGDYLTEVNVTSPTGLQEIERLDGRPVAEEIIRWAVKAIT